MYAKLYFYKVSLSFDSAISVACGTMGGFYNSVGLISHVTLS